jgi:hypothetical protein
MTGGVSETDFTHQLQSVRRTSYTLTAEDANQTVDEYIAGHTIGQGEIRLHFDDGGIWHRIYFAGGSEPENPITRNTGGISVISAG